MAIINDGSSDWPTSKDSYVDEVDDPKTAKTRLRSSIINGIFTWISNTQDDLGGSLKGSKSDAQTRLAVRHANDGTDLDKKRIIGANDITTIQEAIDDLPSAGGEIYVPTGTQSESSASLLESGMHVRGAGYASTIHSSDGTIKVLQAKTGQANAGMSVSNIKLDGESPTIGASGDEQDAAIKFSSSTSTDTIRDAIVGPNVWINDTPGDGVELRYADRNIVHNCIMDLNWQDLSNAVGRNGVALLDGDTLVISNLIIRRACTSGIDLEPALATELINRVVIQNCIIEDCLNGITVNSTIGGLGDIEYVNINNCSILVGDNSATGFNAGTTGIWLKYAKNVAISNCTIHGQSTLSKSGTGIYIQYSDNINIDNCIIKGCLDGIKIDNSDTAPTNELQISDCKVSGCYHAGIYAVNASGNTGDRLTISNCHAFNNSMSGAGSYEGIYADYFDYVNLIGNHGYDDQGTHTQKSGITVNNATVAILIGNICDGNTATQIRAITANITNLEYGHNVGVITFS